MKSFLSQNSWYLPVIYILLAVAAMVQSQWNSGSDATMTSYNNLVIFRQSWYHLKEGLPLYQAYPSEYWDLYKYSPTFAVLMAPIAALPIWLGHLVWNLLNVALVLWALHLLKNWNTTQKNIALGFAAIEMMTSLQNEQSNGLVAGLILMAFAMFERKWLFWAAAAIMLCAYVKVLGLAAGVLLLLYPNKWRTMAYCALWGALLFLVPLLVSSWPQLLAYYHEWGVLLKADSVDPNAYSVMNVLHKYTGLLMSNSAVQAAAAIVFALPALALGLKSDDDDRKNYLASLLIWVVIFNHKAESPTFVIAALGVGIWYAMGRKGMKENIMMLLALVFTVLIATDVFPRQWRKDVFPGLYLKAIPCILIWLWIVAGLYSKAAKHFLSKSS